MDWIDMFQDRDRCRTVTSAVMNLRVGSVKCGEFLDYLRTGWLLRKDCAA